jgi:glutaredoxin 3
MPAVTIYTTSYCPYCTRAKDILRRQQVAYDEVDVSGDQEKRAWLAQVTHQRTVPQIFVGERSIGGCSDLELLVSQGKLDAVLGR